MPNINKMLLEPECFQFTRSLNLNIGYYHTQITEEESILFPHKEKIVTNVYQWEANNLFQDLSLFGRTNMTF